MGIRTDLAMPKDIVMISTADWDAPLWTNKQQIASRLAPDYRVVYVEPMASFGKGSRGYSHTYWRDKSGVFVFRPAVAIPFGQKFEQVNQINHNLISGPLREYIGELGFEEYILWIYTPNGAPFIHSLNPVLTCYDCVDEYSAFPGVRKSLTMRMETELVKGVDVVFTTAKTLYKDKVEKNPNTFYVPNVADFDHFHKAVDIQASREITKLKKPVIGFVGALNYKLDDKLLGTLFSDHPDWNFVFIGPDRGFGIERFMHQQNVHFLGLRTIKDLPSFLAGFDVCIIPYKVDAYTRGVLPIKFFEYLATGKPVVSTPIPELECFRGMIGLASGADEFAYAIEERIAKDTPEQKQERIDLAKQNSWETRINAILTHLEQAYRSKRLTT